MKKANRSRALAALLVLAMVFSLLPGVAVAAEARYVISGWEYNNNELSGSTSIPATTGSGSLTHSAADGIEVSTTGFFAHNKWTTESYWLFSGVDTRGKDHLEIAFRASGSATGPANWAVEYSPDTGETWTEVGRFSLAYNEQMTEIVTLVEEGMELPEGAICENLSVRFRPTDMVSIAGATVAGTGKNKLSFVQITGMSEGYETLASFNFTEAETLPAAADSGYGYLASTTTLTPSFATGALTAKNWAEDDYWLLIFNTSGCTDMNLKASLASSNTGPRQFSIEYSLDNGINWVGVDGYEVTATVKEYSFMLPDEAQSTNLLVRLVVTDSLAVNGGTVGKAGNSKINNVTLTGKVGAERQENPDSPTFPGSYHPGEDGTDPESELPSNAIAGWLFDDAVQLPVKAMVGSGMLASSLTTNPEFTSGALSVKKWAVDAYWLLLANTSGYTGVKLDIKLMSTNTGPRDFLLQYAGADAVWKDITAVTLTDVLTDYSFDIPDEAQSVNCMLRLVVAENVAVSSTPDVPREIGASGASKLNRAVLTGNRTGTHEADPAAFTYPADYNPSTLDPSAGNAEVIGDAFTSWVFTEATALPAAATSGWGTLTHTNSTFTGFSTEALSQTGWSAGMYWQLVANTTGYSQMTLKMRIGSSATGPRNVSLRYTTDLGDTWIEFATLSLTSSVRNCTVQLPDAAQSDNLVIRIVVADSEAINGNMIKNGGSSKINMVLLNGVLDESKRLPDPEQAAYPADWSIVRDYDAQEVFVPEYEEAAQGGNPVAGERRTVAQWGGNANYEGAKFVYGDLLTANDRLDGGAVFTAVVAGEEISPGFTSTGTNSTNYYLGSKSPCIGSGRENPELDVDETTVWTDDYIQLKLSTAKYMNMDMSFRLRVSSKGPKELTMKYSTDGEQWNAFGGGSYDYAYIGYGYGGATYEISGEGEIKGGVIPVEVQGNYMNVSVDVPAGADNAKTLYIRFYASHESCTESSTGNYVTEGASLRLDTLLLTGCPMTDAGICDWVRVNVTDSVPAGQELRFTTPTAGATIKYSYDFGKTVLVYNPANAPVLNTFPATVTVWAEKTGLYPSVKTLYAYRQTQVATVKAIPNGGAVTADTALRLTCATEGAQIRYSFDSGATWSVYKEAAQPVLTEAMLTNGCKVMLMGSKQGCLNSPVTVLEFSLRLNALYNIYFGQLHSHTNYSDGAGSCEEAFAYATQVQNLDFLAVTDHSNAFDNDKQASIADGSMSEKWVSGHELADKYTSEDFVCLYGYEMTWSNGLGHMNTYNTDGFQSRTQNDFSSYSTALQNYYAALKTDVNSISQFNHPGVTFGNFQDYAYYDPDIDALITLIEVGNGDGKVGSSGYFPSYEEYTKALDLGWHLAPTNNQDNHKGRWGDANTARSVILADSLTRSNVYDAMRNRRVYATEDNDLSIYYTLDGFEMGTILTEDDVGDTIHLSVALADPTDTGNCHVEVVANGGMVAAEQTTLVSSSTVTFDLPASYSYYFIRITQADGNLAVTAPVWIGEVESIGVSEVSADTELAVQNESVNITTKLFNNEETDLTVSSIEFMVGSDVVHTVDLKKAGLEVLEAGTNAVYVFPFVYEKLGKMKLEVRVRGEFEGSKKQYSGSLQLTYLSADMISNIIVDGTHANDYVTGYYSGNMTKLTELALGEFARVDFVTSAITPAMLKDCRLLVITAPAKRTQGSYSTSHFSDAFIAMVADYVNAGGSVVLCGLADYNDTTAGQTHTEMNKLLAALGSTMRLRSDEVARLDSDNTLLYGLELTDYAAASPWLAGASGQMSYSLYSACSVDLTDAGENDKVFAAQALISGGEDVFSVDVKTDTGYSVSTEGDSINYVVPEGQVTAAAVQDTKAGGHIFVAGSVFVSDYDIQTDENQQQLNTVLTRNIIAGTAKQMERTTIAEARKGKLGDAYRIEGWVTAGTDNEYNKFFDTIYIQDETGGITIFPYADSGLKLGTRVSVTGYLDAYQDDLEMQVLQLKLLDGEQQIAPLELSCKDAMDYAAHGGKLIKTVGTIIDVELQGTAVTQLKLKNEQGEIATVFIDGYITSGTTGKNELAAFCTKGTTVSAVGLCFMHPETGSDYSSCCLRVRNCDEIIKLGENHGVYCPSAAFKDMDVNAWYHEAADEMLDAGLMSGVGGGLFQPNALMTRAMLVSVLWRSKGSPAPTGKASFTDVPAGKWYTDAVLWCAENDIVAGVGDGKFAPELNITREQIATILYRYYMQSGVALPSYPTADGGPLAGFPDAGQISDFARYGMEFAVAAGVLSGRGSNGKVILAPRGNASRVEVASLLQRFLKLLN